MCGRYTLTIDTDELSDRFGCVIIQRLGGPRYNIAPQQKAQVIINNKGEVQMRRMQWGLVPSWAKDRSVGSKMINARCETLAGKTSFNKSLRKRRCLVPADGYYEWQKLGREKQPYRVVLPTRDMFCFAGIWDEWIADDGEVLQSFSIITTDAAPAVSKIHHRMPFIIEREHEHSWLCSGIINSQEVKEFMSGFKPVDTLQAYKVSKIVNSVKNDVAECIQPLQDNPSQSLFDE